MEQARERTGGIWAYPVTPTTSDGEPDTARQAALIDRMIAAGVDGITILGSTGAIGSFAESERMRIAEAAIAHVAGRVPVAVGTGAITTAEAVRLSRHAARCGAARVLVVPITYWRLTDDEVVAHYRAIAEAVGVPVGVYNNPRLTVMDLQPALIARLAAIPGVAFLKETSTDLARLPVVRRLAGPKLEIAWGRDGGMLDALRLGADGWHSATANVMPERCVALFRAAARDPDSAEARDRYEAVRPFIEFAVEKGLVRSMHAALEIAGAPAGAPRPPILPLAGDDRRRLEQLMRDAGIASA